MSTHRFARTVADLPGALRRAKDETLARGGEFDGDLAAGRFALRTPLGPIEGNYTAAGHEVVFVVTRKPALVPNTLIGKVLDQILEGRR